jgi:hypothetical protein
MDRTLPAQRSNNLPLAGLALSLGQHVQLGQYQPAFAAGQVRAVTDQFLLQGANVGHRITTVAVGRDVNQMQQKPGPGQMFEKPDTQTGPFGGTLDQAGNVGHDEAAGGAEADYTEIRSWGEPPIPR